MAFGNGSSSSASHHLKRGFLRPNGGSRLPAFLIIGLLAGCSFLLYNLYSITIERNSLDEEMNLIRKKWQTCQRDKTELETRFETHGRSFKTMKEELERMRTVERSSIESQKELKQCREQLVTQQNENADLKEEQKTEVENCQRKLKETEEKLDPCTQDKSRLEGEIEVLRTNLSATMQQAQAAAAVHSTSDQQSTAGQNKETESNLSPIVPHRGVPADEANAQTVAKETSNQSNNVAISTISNGNDNRTILPTGSNDESLRISTGNERNRVSNTESASAAPVSKEDIAKTSAKEEHGTDERKPASTAAAASEQSPQLPSSDVGIGHRATENSAVGGGESVVAAKDSDTDRKPEDKNNGTSLLDSNGRNQVVEKLRDGAIDSATMTLKKRRKQKERRLNKVIEESAPVDERRRNPSNVDRSRGEQDDTAQPTDSPDPITLMAVVPKRISIEGRGGQPVMDVVEEKSSNGFGDRRVGVNNADIPTTTVAPAVKDGGASLDALLAGRSSAKDSAGGTFSATTAAPSAVDSGHRQSADESRVGLPAPIDTKLDDDDQLKPPKLEAKKGLKEDDLYKDDDEEADTFVGKNGKQLNKKPVGNEIDEPTDKKSIDQQIDNRKDEKSIGQVEDNKENDGGNRGSNLDKAKQDDAEETKLTREEKRAMKKNAKLAEDEEVEKRLPKDDESEGQQLRRRNLNSIDYDLNF